MDRQPGRIGYYLRNHGRNAQQPPPSRPPNRVSKLLHKIVSMAGLDVNTPKPTHIVLHQLSRELEIGFEDGSHFRFSFEFLRVHSPSAEVQGHSPEQAVLQVGKADVLITELEPVGHYALRPVFSDGHASGLYSWDYLYRLGQDQAQLWQQYLDELARRGLSRS